MFKYFLQSLISNISLFKNEKILCIKTFFHSPDYQFFWATVCYCGTKIFFKRNICQGQMAKNLSKQKNKFTLIQTSVNRLLLLSGKLDIKESKTFWTSKDQTTTIFKIFSKLFYNSGLIWSGHLHSWTNLTIALNSIICACILYYSSYNIYCSLSIKIRG